jgi:regulator of sigma E protease
MSVFLLVLGVILFISLVILHEFGHYIMARRNGVVAEEFGIFFPPRLWSRKLKNGTVFSINLLPFGGFVKMKGEHDSDTEKGSFGAATLAGKTKIMAAGVVVNLIIAFILFLVLAWIGMPRLVDNQFTVKSDTKYLQKATDDISIGSLEKGSPADVAGLKAGDQLLAVGPKGNLTPVISAASLPSVTKKYSGQVVEVKYLRHGKVMTTSAHLHSTPEVKAAAAQCKPIGYLGIGPDEARSGVSLTRSTWSAPVVAVGLMGQFTALTFQGIGKALAGVGGIFAGAATSNKCARQAAQTQASSQVSGPVGVYFVLKDGAALGYRFMLIIIAIVSLTLAIMNLLPIPALDGGRLWITLISRAIKKPLSPHTEEVVNASGFVVLFALIILITILDIKRFF